MLLLIRHWLLPGRLRRLPNWARPILLAPTGFALYMVLVPQLAPDTRLNVSLRYVADVAEFWINGLFPTLIAIVSLIGGAVTISAERQSMRLEEMLTTRLSVSEVVNAALTVRFFQVLTIIYPTYFATVYRDHFQYWQSYQSSDPWNPVVIVWSLAAGIARPITFILLGMLISSAARRVQSALAVAGGLIAAYAAVFVVSSGYYYGFYFGSSATYDEHYYAHLFYWPISNFDRWGHGFWQLDLLADGVLGVALPITCYWLCRRLCGRRS